jgi:hypothetical protein
MKLTTWPTGTSISNSWNGQHKSSICYSRGGLNLVKWSRAPCQSFGAHEPEASDRTKSGNSGSEYQLRHEHLFVCPIGRRSLTVRRSHMLVLTDSLRGAGYSLKS